MSDLWGDVIEYRGITSASRLVPLKTPLFIPRYLSDVYIQQAHYTQSLGNVVPPKSGSLASSAPAAPPSTPRTVREELERDFVLLFRTPHGPEPALIEDFDEMLYASPCNLWSHSSPDCPSPRSQQASSSTSSEHNAGEPVDQRRHSVKPADTLRTSSFVAQDESGQSSGQLSSSSSSQISSPASSSSNSQSSSASTSSSTSTSSATASASSSSVLPKLRPSMPSRGGVLFVSLNHVAFAAPIPRIHASRSANLKRATSINAKSGSDFVAISHSQSSDGLSANLAAAATAMLTTTTPPTSDSDSDLSVAPTISFSSADLTRNRHSSIGSPSRSLTLGFRSAALSIPSLPSMASAPSSLTGSESADRSILFFLLVLPIADLLCASTLRGPTDSGPSRGAVRFTTAHSKLYFSHLPATDTFAVRALVHQLHRLILTNLVGQLQETPRPYRLFSSNDFTLCEELARRRRNARFLCIFRMPREELLLFECPARLTSSLQQQQKQQQPQDDSRQADWQQAGTLYYSRSFLCWQSADETLKFAYYLGDVELEFSARELPPAGKAKSKSSKSSDKSGGISLLRPLSKMFGGFGSSSSSSSGGKKGQSRHKEADGGAAATMEMRIATPGYAAVRLVFTGAYSRSLAADVRLSREHLVGSSSGNSPAIAISNAAPAAPAGDQSPRSVERWQPLSSSDGDTARSALRALIQQTSVFHCAPLASVRDALEAPFDYQRLVGTSRGLQAESGDKLPAWGEYFARNGRGTWMLRTPDLQQLIVRGIPCSLRGEMWMLLSGAVHLGLVQPSLYADVCRKINGPEAAAIAQSMRGVVEQIDKDLLRVFGGHAVITDLPSASYVPWENPSCLGAIRRVLVAHSYRNRAVGYTQGMHELVGLLLVFLDESEAFLLLSTLCETLLPYHYSSTSYGCLAEIDLLREYVYRAFPHVVAHVSASQYAEDELGMKILDCYLLKWVFSLFTHGAHCVTFECVVRIWDLLFSAGKDNTVVVRCCLALVDILQDAILATQSEDELGAVFQHSVVDPDQLVALAVKHEASVPQHEAKELRYFYQTSRINDITAHVPRQRAALQSADILLPGSASLLERSSSAPPAQPLDGRKTHSRNHRYHRTLPYRSPADQLAASPDEDNFQPLHIIEAIEKQQKQHQSSPIIEKQIDCLFKDRAQIRDTFHLDDSLLTNQDGLVCDLPNI